MPQTGRDMKDPFSDAFRRELTRALNTANGKKKREVLTVKRDVLFAQFLRNPEDIRLALEIKFIDDQVALCCEQMRQERKKRI
jgi:hypothetical protein